MTESEWKKAENALGSIFGHVKFKIDGYNVSVGYVRETPTKYCLAVYIDGKFEGKWCTEDCEIRRRFCHSGRKQIISGREKTKLIKEIGKRDFERFSKQNPDRLYYTYYEPYFGSFRTLKSHFIKNNDTIELVEAKGV